MVFRIVSIHRKRSEDKKAEERNGRVNGGNRARGEKASKHKL